MVRSFIVAVGEWGFFHVCLGGRGGGGLGGRGSVGGSELGGRRFNVAYPVLAVEPRRSSYRDN